MTRSTQRIDPLEPILPTDWLMPDWHAPTNVRAVCTTRSGGASTPPYDSMNLGDHVGDDPAHVAANRALFQQAIGAKPVFLNQVHGTDVLPLDAATPHASVADACLTDQLGVACTIMVADCLPVLFTTLDGRWVAAAHAGWRGLAGQQGVGILETTCQRLRAATAGSQVKDAQRHANSEIIAWLGPCIGPQAFEVGDEVRTAFVAHDPQAAHMFCALGDGKWLADLAGLARQRLQAIGVQQIDGNNGSADWCTVTQSSRFFSHRRDRVSGRQAASIWRSA